MVDPLEDAGDDPVCDEVVDGAVAIHGAGLGFHGVEFSGEPRTQLVAGYDLAGIEAIRVSHLLAS